MNKKEENINEDDEIKENNNENNIGNNNENISFHFYFKKLIFIEKLYFNKINL